MIYLDNAATTAKKPHSVLRDIKRNIKRQYGNPGRGSHTLSVRAGEVIYDTSEALSALLSAPCPENVVFTYNATYALNIAIKAMVREKCHIIISDMEHNSVYRPVIALCEQYGCEYSVFNTAAKSILSEIEGLIRSDTKILISTLSSNVNGREVPLEALSYVRRKHGIKLVIDASQAIGHKRINLSESPCDALCAPGHKALFGLQGTGFIYFDENFDGKTIIEGGSGNESANINMPRLLPERFEAGTLSTPAIASLKAGIKYIENIGIERIEAKIVYLTNALLDRLSSVKSVGMLDGNNGVVSFNLKGTDCERVAWLLNARGIFVRSGLHCAPLAHKAIGTLESGTVRVSLSVLNTEKELDIFYRAITEISR